MTDLTNVAALRQAIHDYCDFSRPVTVKWQDTSWRGSSKHGDIVYDGALSIGLEFGQFFSNRELGYWMGFYRVPRTEPTGTAIEFEDFYPEDLISVLDAIIDAAGVEAYFLKIIFEGMVSVKSMFSMKDKYSYVTMSPGDINMYLSSDDYNVIVVEAPLEIRGFTVDQGGQAGNF